MTNNAAKKKAAAAAAKEDREEKTADQEIVDFLIEETELPSDVVEVEIRGRLVEFHIRGLNRDETVAISKKGDAKNDGDVGYEAAMMEIGIIKPK